MGKKVNLIFAGLVFIALTAFLMVDSAKAFCVYNKTDITISVVQSFGSKPLYEFGVIMKPGDKECCNWQNGDCNTGGKRDSMVGFDVDGHGCMCQWFRIQAGGWLTVEGKNGNYKCVRHDH